jgi:diguanylate cyclase (GGDEF)-like protein
MSQQTPRWGLFYFSIAPALAAALLLIVAYAPVASGSVLMRRALPAAGLLLSAIAFIAGRYSYPRVHNCKVYLAGYATGLTGLAYFGLYRIPSPLANSINALYILIALNFLLFFLAPAYRTWRTTRQTTFTIVVIELALLLTLRLVPEAAAWASALDRTGVAPFSAAGAIIWFAAVMLLSAVSMRRAFSLGGVVAGCALLYALAWLAPLYAAHHAFAEMLFFAAAPLYLEIGIVVHSLARMDHRIAYDPLLQIYNRAYCSQILREQSRLNTAPPLGVAMVDIDHFKKVNDTHGHQAGDAILYSVAQTIQRTVVPEGIACRYGGEEIAVFFPRTTDKQTLACMERVREAVAKTNTPVGRKKLSVTVSCGVSCRDRSDQSIEQVMAAADKALYRAKKGGRNQVKSARAGAGAAKSAH